MNIKLTVIVLTHNDELRIVDCLESVSFADEIIVIDDKSTDRTIDLALGFTKKIYSKQLQNNFASQRNFGLDQAHGDWILFVDSDEIVSQNLKNEILTKIQNTTHFAYRLKRIDYMWGRKILHGEGGSVRLVRLAKKGKGKWHGKVHEEWRVNESIGELQSSLIHVPHQSVKAFLKDIDEYSTIRVDELSEKGVRSGFIKIILYPVAKFFVNYFL